MERPGRKTRKEADGSRETAPSTGRSEGRADLPFLEKRVAKLLASARSAEQEMVHRADYPDADALLSARNLAAYLGVRRHDLRKLQRGLRAFGLNPLGHIEPDAQGALRRVSAALASLRGIKSRSAREAPGARTGEEILCDRATALLGQKPLRRSARVMVTMPTEAAGSYVLVRDLIEAGAGIMRITCAHDGPEAWRRMIEHVRRAEKETGRQCLVMADLSGPKLRTGPIERGLAALTWRPFKNGFGEVMEPARIWLGSGAPPPDTANASVPVHEGFWRALRPGDEIHFRDHQDREREMLVREVREDGAWAESDRKAVLVEGIPLAVHRDGEAGPVGIVGPVTSVSRRLLMKTGDLLALTCGDALGKAAVYDAAGSLVSPHQIGCTLPEVFRDAQPGQRVFFDDGKIAGVIEDVTPEAIRVRITWTRGARAWLSEEKGINLPDTDLRVAALTRKDREDMAFFVCGPLRADIIGMSFVKSNADVREFLTALADLGADDVGALVKIENSVAFESLPEILLTVLARPRVGMMIARGDLGVEVGFERMAELQEDILSLCNAAHLPVVWATEVLETLAKKGMPSRAEVSDAVMAARTQCVMLNKGPFIRTAVNFLVDVMERMEEHQEGQFRLMRKLTVALPPASSGSSG